MTVEQWLIQNDIYTDAYLVDINGKAVNFFFDNSCYQANVLQVAEINDYTCRLYTDYREG